MPMGSLLGAPFFASAQPTHEEGDDRRRREERYKSAPGSFTALSRVFCEVYNPSALGCAICRKSGVSLQGGLPVLSTLGNWGGVRA